PGHVLSSWKNRRVYRLGLRVVVVFGVGVHVVDLVSNHAVRQLTRTARAISPIVIPRARIRRILAAILAGVGGRQGPISLCGASGFKSSPTRISSGACFSSIASIRAKESVS